MIRVNRVYDATKSSADKINKDFAAYTVRICCDAYQGDPLGLKMDSRLWMFMTTGELVRW